MSHTLQRFLTCALLTVVPLAVAGCNADLDKLLDRLSGLKTETVVFAKAPVSLTPVPKRFAAPEPFSVVGSSASACIVLAGNVPLNNGQVSIDIDSVIGKLMQDAKLDVNMVSEDGKKYPLTSQGNAWAMMGRVVDRDEIAACYSAKCGETLAVGSKYVAVEIAATPALEIKGGYWMSSDAFDKYQPRSAPAPAKDAAPEKSAQATATSPAKCSS